ncbi:MAG: hypothetical protein AAGI24_10720 [Pseudomonadota bacterium]
MPTPRALSVSGILYMLLPGLLLLAGCTQQAVYEAIQNSERLECQKEARTVLYLECMERFSLPYEDYKQQRDAILKGDS